MDLLSWLMYLVSYMILFQALLAITRKLGRRAKLPPGPPPIPIFGNLFQLGDNPHKSLAKLASVHGDIMTLKLGQITTIVFSSATMAEEIFQKHDAVSCNRTVPDAIRALRHHEVGLPWMPVSTTWRNHRKICKLHIFASHRLNANQYLRRTKVEQLLADVRHSSRVGEAVEIRQAAFKTTLSFMSNTIFSIDLSDSSQTSEEFREIVQGILEELRKPNFGDYFPIANLDLQGNRRRMTIHLRKIMDLFDNVIDERVELRRMSEYVSTNDLLDTLLQLSQENNQKLDKNQIKNLILVLFTAATETTTSTIEWAMAELLHNPQALLEARREKNNWQREPGGGIQCYLFTLFASNCQGNIEVTSSSSFFNPSKS
ncbi:hypothetical protein ES319_D08G212700v1 [Gossypium barbadense]|uniref:Cytochrome P450 n=3 Tax=Gossypium TaxID=3633 RepID=A0A5J5QI87_GOSBA|nr:hypothetical protein ES319_D08G212700v1 [Gossypium barbadense]TYG58451.1 hypothetical protein ES288_D08G224200v1 [Gossypium darwinii]TYH59438.1 hypothetical protein ES332_D08G221600v1 [Gossypium tomentosum]